MQKYEHILVGLRCDAGDDGLIRYAAELADLGEAVEVRFVHIMPADAEHAHDHDAVLNKITSEVKRHLGFLTKNVRVHFDVLKGPLVDRLLSHAAEQEVDLILVGHHRNPTHRLALAKRLAMNAPCSVWMVPDGSPAEIRKILVPVDFSDHSANTLSVALALAEKLRHSECLTAHIQQHEANNPDELRVAQGQEQEAFRQFINPINTRGLNVVPLFEVGAQVAPVLCQLADKHAADLIVMGTRGRSRSASILLGSVTEQTMTETKVPLLVVKHYGAQMGVLEALLSRSFRARSAN